MKHLKYNYIILVAAVLLFSCGKQPEQAVIEGEVLSNDRTETVVDPSGEITKTTLTEATNNRIIVTGYIDVPPENRAAVSPYFGGYVKNIKVLAGQKVQKGEVLFELQNPDYLQIQQAYLEAKEQIEYLKTDFERQKTLSDEQIASAKNYKKAEADYKVVLARYTALQEQIKLMGLSVDDVEAGKLYSILTIRAPIAGRVNHLNVSNGTFADAREVALDIVNTDHIHLELEVYEKDALSVKQGQTIDFMIPESGSKTFKGEVYLVGNSVDLKKRTVQVHGHIDEEKELSFIPGMFVEAKIYIE